MEFNWFMVRNNTNNYVYVDIILAYTRHLQQSFDCRHKSSISYSYVNLAHNHLIWSLMVSTRSHISRWPDNISRRRKAQTLNINHGLTSSQSTITITEAALPRCDHHKS